MGDELLTRLSYSDMPSGFHPEGFDCHEADLNDYILDGTALRDEASNVSKTYLVWDRDDFVGYFSVLTDAIQLSRKERPEGVTYSVVPALKLGRMGVDEPFQGRGVGHWILGFVIGLAWELSRRAGLRYVTLDALKHDGLVAWYHNYGFVRNQGEEERRRTWFARWRKEKPSAVELENVSMRYDIFLQPEIKKRKPLHVDTPVTPTP